MGNRYRNHGELAVTAQDVSVGDGGNVIVGNVTQHASATVREHDSCDVGREPLT